MTIREDAVAASRAAGFKPMGVVAIEVRDGSDPASRLREEVVRRLKHLPLAVTFVRYVGCNTAFEQQ